MVIVGIISPLVGATRLLAFVVDRSLSSFRASTA